MTDCDRQPTLSRDECSALRGLAIAAIALHNYCHLLRIAVKENEFTFSYANADGLWHALLHHSCNLPIHLVSFFGHYGVPVFLFLSAYGLTQKYERGKEGVGVWAFVKSHYLKLFPMMVVGFACYLIVDRLSPRPHVYHFIDVASMLGMVGNFLPQPHRVIWPGPYWFFGLMMQLYVIYRLLLYRRSTAMTLLLMAACMVAQCFCDPMGDTLNSLRYNAVGAMLPFGLGLVYARYERRLPSWAYAVAAVLAAVLVVAWSMDYWSWLWTPAAVCVLAVATVKVLPESAVTGAAWLGAISSAMFVCHPITRRLFLPVSQHGDVYTGLLMYVVATVVLSLIFRQLIPRLSGR